MKSLSPCFSWLIWYISKFQSHSRYALRIYINPSNLILNQSVPLKRSAATSKNCLPDGGTCSLPLGQNASGRDRVRGVDTGMNKGGGALLLFIKWKAQLIVLKVKFTIRFYKKKNGEKAPNLHTPVSASSPWDWNQSDDFRIT